MSSLMSLTMIVSPVFMTELFYTFSREGAPIDFPGAPFLAAALLIVVALGFFTRAARCPSIQRPSKAYFASAFLWTMKRFSSAGVKNRFTFRLTTPRIIPTVWSTARILWQARCTRSRIGV